ncbi:hypothetical protein LXA43DRAFT_514919 [Ganoderma leucocontextum]|nr:hypothetical protein LXA43DRAFT_514919 [Ganoderma leucocontextum]
MDKIGCAVPARRRPRGLYTQSPCTLPSCTVGSASSAKHRPPAVPPEPKTKPSASRPISASSPAATHPTTHTRSSRSPASLATPNLLILPLCLPVRSIAQIGYPVHITRRSGCPSAHPVNSTIDAPPPDPDQQTRAASVGHSTPTLRSLVAAASLPLPWATHTSCSRWRLDERYPQLGMVRSLVDSHPRLRATYPPSRSTGTMQEHTPST